ncbi:MAG: hypothetical protein E7263_10635 [Lachnospiraceae bacterium]|nr:hypothetical protein [Lachnospiraceae bacterium]
MDILFEIIIELMVELTIGDLDFPSNNKLSKPVKIIVTVLFATFYIALIVMITWAAITSLNKGEYEMFAFLLVVDIIVAVGVICALVKKYKKVRKM